MREIQFQNGNYYHIYNRGVDKRDIFIDKKDFIRFILSMREFDQEKPIGSLYSIYKNKKRKDKSLSDFESHLETSEETAENKLIKIICYCLNANHYHILLQQTSEEGIQKFMHKLGMGYTRYFNGRYIRSGSLFQGTYKAVAVKTDAQLIYLSAYINGNSEIHKVKKADCWPWSSYLDYLGKRNGTLCGLRVILNQFKSAKDYQAYVHEVVHDSSEIKEEVKKCLLE